MLVSLQRSFPELAEELRELFRREGKPELADQVGILEIVDRCRCGDDFCATMYTISKPKGAWGANHYTLPLEPEKGMILVDLLDDRIAEIEILYRNEIREKLLRAIP